MVELPGVHGRSADVACMLAITGKQSGEGSHAIVAVGKPLDQPGESWPDMPDISCLECFDDGDWPSISELCSETDLSQAMALVPLEARHNGICNSAKQKDVKKKLASHAKQFVKKIEQVKHLRHVRKHGNKKEQKRANKVAKTRPTVAPSPKSVD